MSKNIELRQFAPLELRADADKPPVIEGYAAMFDQETVIGNAYREVIRLGAFEETLRSDDVVLLINHDGLPLGRTRADTLTVKEDSKGLFINSELNAEDPDVTSIVAKMRRGDLDKMSFAFWPEKEAWSDPEDGSEMPLREVLRAKLYDVSIVTTPAYDGTQVGLRGLERYKAQHARRAPAHAIKARFKSQLIAMGRY